MIQRVPGPTVTVSENNLLQRSGPLKAALVAFGQSQRFAGEFRSAYADRFGTAEPSSDVDRINFLDRFVLEHRTRDGRTVVEQFVGSRPELPEAERAPCSCAGRRSSRASSRSNATTATPQSWSTWSTN
jgi:hypothetical protein